MKFFNSIKNFDYFFICAVPLFFILGSFFSNLLTIVSVFYFFFYFKNIETKDKKIFYKYFILFFLFLFFTSIFSEYQIYSFKSSLSYLRYYFYILFLIIIFNQLNENKLKNITIFFSLLILFVIIDTFLQYINGVDIFGYSKYHSYNRLTGPLGENNLIVGHFLLYFGFLTYSLLLKIYRPNFFIKILIPFILIIIIFLTGERNAYYSIFILFSFLLFFSKKLKFQSLLILLIWALVFFIGNKFELVGKKYSISSLSNLPTVEKNISSNDYKSKIVQFSKSNQWFAHFAAGLEIFKSKPFTGSGFKTFRKSCYDRFGSDNLNLLCTIHPHNIYIEVLSDTGIIGFLILLFLGLWILIIFLKKKINYNYSNSLIVGLFLTYIFPFKVHGSIFSSNYAYIMWTLFSFTIVVIVNKNLLLKQDL